jgi:ABC-type transport system involved in multi-copper enzyme maturation permease subunit
VLSRLWAITKNSFTEIIRQPVYGILLLAGMTMIGLSPVVTMFGLDRSDKMLVDMGLGTILLLGLVVAVLSATHVVSHEIEVQTVAAILSKPVGRFLFVLAKFIAVTMAMAVCSYILTIVLLIALRIGVPTHATMDSDTPAVLMLILPLLLAFGVGMYANFFYRWNFTSTAIIAGLVAYTLSFGLSWLISAEWAIAPGTVYEELVMGKDCDQVAVAAFLVFIGVWVMSSVAVALSTRVNVVANVTICLAVFFVGMISQFLFGQFAAHSWPAWLALRIVPSLHVFWVGDQLMAEAPFIPLSYVKLTLGYALCFCAAMVFLAGFLFERREVV